MDTLVDACGVIVLAAIVVYLGCMGIWLIRRGR